MKWYSYPAGDPSLHTALLSFSKIFCVGGGSRELHLDKAYFKKNKKGKNQIPNLKIDHIKCDFKKSKFKNRSNAAWI
jgi:hypothetical protein